ncbi:50S ribosomal protein L4 [Desulforhopalus singaporensis]|uniref:Large ribosomal subunit protein uL4 n=1 Tax=Desulforhopalus singaporensis TaxID=91360 RepID=A0A1H0RBU9_9BACT|nr:50S ribosomal protein L4 [Desulforhopalus singaporensis]SDP26516.1 LSU ribosomal protein L4P [Desulforhopalus singaporensis]
MSTVNIVNTKNESVGEIELNDAVFNREVKPYILHEVVRMQRAAKRAGNACTKTRVEVSGGGKKPWRQKGTGRARSGTRTSPLWRGGGVTFGPKPRDYAFKVNKKVRKQAVSMALSARFQEGNLVVVDDFNMDEIKTKDFVSIMNLLEIDNGLIVTDDASENLAKSSRNVNGYKILSSEGLNVYDILLHKKIILVQPVIGSLEKRLMA